MIAITVYGMPEAMQLDAAGVEELVRMEMGR